MPLSTAVIIATKGRVQDVSNLLDALELQTVPPELIVISASEQRDVNPDRVSGKNVEVIFGPPGLTAQRNRALSAIHGKCDVVVFFDDDFIPSRFWIENAGAALAAEPDVVCVTGHVLLDGVMIGGVERSHGQSLVDKADASSGAGSSGHTVKRQDSPYGCNMAFRATDIEHLTFDERLVLYGWLEDRDFSFRAGAKTIWTDALWGVHLGTTQARSSGRSFGYSQVVNPWYLTTKGTMTWVDAYGAILRALAANTLGSLFPEAAVDRHGRLRGNIIAIKDLLRGSWAPEKAAEL